MRRFSPITDPRPTRSFTLVEMLVSMAVLVILLGVLFAITNSVSKTVLYTSTKIDAFAAGRASFDLMSQKLSQATLNTYWDYDNPVTPAHYYRQSDLQFLVRQNVQKSGYGQEVYFPSPSTYSTTAAIRSTDGLLNACGFFVAYCPDYAAGPPAAGFRPGVLPAAVATHYRYRLIQGLEPTENLAIYANWPATPTLVSNPTPAQVTAYGTAWTTYWGTTWPAYWNAHAWVANSIGNPGNGTLNTDDTPLANNVIALIVCPRLSQVDDPPGGTTDGTNLTPNYLYDSQSNALTLNATTGYQPKTANQLPPTVQLTMIVISEASAARLCTSATQPTVIENALNGKFVLATYTQYQADLADLSAKLEAANVAFQIFTTTVTMKESKWSDYSQ